MVYWELVQSIVRIRIFNLIFIPGSDPSSTPSNRFFVSNFRPKFFTKLYFTAHAKYWSWKWHQGCQLKCSSDLDDLQHIKNQTFTDIVDDHTQPSCNKYYTYLPSLNEWIVFILRAQQCVNTSHLYARK